MGRRRELPAKFGYAAAVLAMVAVVLAPVVPNRPSQRAWRGDLHVNVEPLSPLSKASRMQGRKAIRD